MAFRLPESLTIFLIGNHDANGLQTFGAGVVVDGRWEDDAETFVAEAGESQKAMGVAFLDKELIDAIPMTLEVESRITRGAFPGAAHSAQPTLVIRKIEAWGGMRGSRKLVRLWLV